MERPAFGKQQSSNETSKKKRANLPERVHVAAWPDLHLPPAFVGDDAFPQGENLMKPFGGKSVTYDQNNFQLKVKLPKLAQTF